MFIFSFGKRLDMFFSTFPPLSWLKSRFCARTQCVLSFKERLILAGIWHSSLLVRYLTNGVYIMRMLIDRIYWKWDLQKRWLSNYLFVFGLFACDICNGQPTRVQMSKFGDVFKALTVSYLNFVDTDLGPKMLLKRPKWTCKRATVAPQLWPFQLSSVALLQVRRARMRKTVGSPGDLKPTSHTIWRVFMEVIL